LRLYKVCASPGFRHTILAAEDLDKYIREREKSLELLSLRKSMDTVKEWEGEVARWEKVLADPSLDGEYASATRLVHLARRALELSKQKVVGSLNTLKLMEEKEVYKRQLAALDEVE
jgi:hypothetical protein